MSIQIKAEVPSRQDADFLECRLRDTNMFKGLLQCSAAFQADYLTLRIKKDGIEYISIDEHHVALCEWELQREAFEFFSSSTSSGNKFFEISLSMELITKVLKICKAREVICLHYDTAAEPNILNLRFLDPRNGTGAPPPAAPSAVKQEPGQEEAASAKSSVAHKMNEFRIVTRPLSGTSDSLLEIPPLKEDSTSVQLPASCFKYVIDSLIELNINNQKETTLYVQCPKTSIVDGKTGAKQEQDIVRFGTSNTSGDVNVDFIVAGNLESSLEMGEQVLMTRKDGFGDADRCRFLKKWIDKMGIALPIVQHMSFHLCTTYPWIAVLPLLNDAGMIRYVVSPRNDEKEDVAEEAGGADAADDDLFAEEDEFSD